MRISEFAPSLWHLLGLDRKARARARARARTRNGEPDNGAATRPKRRPVMQARYDALVAEMKAAYAVRVHKWRTNTSGCAWVVRYADGTTSRLIEAPYPRGPMSCAVFLHEIGHHAIGWDRHRLRCVEEYAAWQWALDAMRERGLNVTPAVEKRMRESVGYALAKARRRGLKRVPAELGAYLQVK